MKYYLISTILFSLCYAICAGPMQVLDLEPVKECVKSGMMCDTCTSSAMCVKVGNAFKKVNQMTCPDGTTCLGGTCTKEVNPPCDYANIDFPCQYTGAYPHPGDWSKYIYCVPNGDGTFNAVTIDCEPGTGYNAQTTYCSRNLTTISPNVFPITRCLEPSQNPLVHPDNPSIYYICSQIQGWDKLYPMQFTCPSGGAFKDGECIITLSDETNRNWLSSGHEGPVHLWDAFTGTLRCSYRGYNAVDEIDPALSVCFSADGQSIFCGSKKSVKTFATSRPGREYYAYEVSHPASCIVASEAQPGVVAIGSWKNTIELVSQSDGTFRHLCKLQGHKGGITSMAFSLDGYKLFSGARKDKEIICWDLRVPGRPLFCLGREVNTNQKIAIDLSRCGRYLVSGGTDGKVLAWDISLNCAPQENYQMPLHSDCCNGVSLHPTKPILATSSGQHHTMDPLHHTRSSFSYENSLCMWWLGNQQEDPDLITAIIRAATNS